MSNSDGTRCLNASIHSCQFMRWALMPGRPWSIHGADRWRCRAAVALPMGRVCHAIMPDDPQPQTWTTGLLLPLARHKVVADVEQDHAAVTGRVFQVSHSSPRRSHLSRHTRRCRFCRSAP